MRVRHAIAPALALALLACTDPVDQTGDIPKAPEAGEATLQMGPGLYAVGNEDTDYARTRINPDGTYIDMTVEGEEVGGGTWTTRGELICFDPVGDEEDQLERCWTNGPLTEAGSFTTTRDDESESYRVTPIEE